MPCHTNALRCMALAILLPPQLAMAKPDGLAQHMPHDRPTISGVSAQALTKEGQEEQVFNLPLADGANQRLFYAAPPRPWATIVMLPGGDGDVGMKHDGGIEHGDNFVVRTRHRWVARGYAILIPDTIDHANLRGVRSSPAYADLIGRVVRFAHNQWPGPVFLLGTSQGSIAAMNGAAHATPGSIAGVVLTESVSRMGGSHETVFSASPRDVTAPALIVANRDDTCDVAPPEDAPRIAAAMTRAHDVRVLFLAGGIMKSHRVCGSLTPHGYYGIEAAVIDRIDQWMQSHAMNR